MKCPKCGNADTKVLESRLSHEGRSVRRRRMCLGCNARFTTYEKEEVLVFQVRKKDGTIEPYQREKAQKAIQIACQKRPITIDDIETLLSRIERTIQEEGVRIVHTQRVGDMIMTELRAMDKVAYVRFASVYKDFKDPAEFMSELRYLSSQAQPSPLSSMD